MTTGRINQVAILLTRDSMPRKKKKFLKKGLFYFVPINIKTLDKPFEEWAYSKMFKVLVQTPKS